MGANYISELTVSFLRPMARRREITARPSAVFMRVRKPWVVARRRLFGWKVRLGILVSYDGGLENSSVQHGAAFLIRDGYSIEKAALRRALRPGNTAKSSVAPPRKKGKLRKQAPVKHECPGQLRTDPEKFRRPRIKQKVVFALDYRGVISPPSFPVSPSASLGNLVEYASKYFSPEPVL